MDILIPGNIHETGLEIYYNIDYKNFVFYWNDGTENIVKNVYVLEKLEKCIKEFQEIVKADKKGYAYALNFNDAIKYSPIKKAVYEDGRYYLLKDGSLENMFAKILISYQKKDQ